MEICPECGSESVYPSDLPGYWKCSNCNLLYTNELEEEILPEEDDPDIWEIPSSTKRSRSHTFLIRIANYGLCYPS